MSSIELVTAYLAERARPTVFVPLALLIAETAWLAAPGTESTAASFGMCAMQALLLIMALRIWDDLQDRARDAAPHPNRVAVRARHVAPLVAFGVALAVGGVVSLVFASVPAARLAVVVAIAAGLAVWYHARPAEPSRLSGAVLLAKYPALAIALAPGLDDLSPLRAGAATGTLYLVAFTYEYLEDRHRGIA
jgi:4-hydroxybenzoate polyprenyltransferase